MAAVEVLDMEGAPEFQTSDVFDEQIEVVEQCVDEPREQNIIGDIKDLIFDSPLPTYIPVLPPGFEVDSFFVCEECGDKFAVESSFQFHKERRSLLIKYDCPECENTIKTYNRCNLLAHLRMHGNASRNTLDWNRVTVSPLPFDKMLIGPLFNIGEYEETISNMSEFSNLNDSVKRCPECEIHLRSDLRDHFLGAGNGIPVDHNNKCSYCHLILNSKCSLKAHERYHRQEKPFICPDCAKIFNMWASFCVHLFYCCFHLDKCVRYRCPACRAFLPSTVSLEVHILTLHVKNVFKCNACPIACFSLQTLEEHKVKGHGHTSLPTNAYQQCQLCPDRLIPKARLLFHVIEHVRKPSVCVYGYQCSTCKLFYQKKSEFAAHKSNCSEQSSNSVNITNGLVMVKVKNQNQNVLNGHTSYVSSTDMTSTCRKDPHLGRIAMKTAACQTKTNGNHVPKDTTKCNQTRLDRFDRNWDNKNNESVNDPLNAERTESVVNSKVSCSNNVEEHLLSDEKLSMCSTNKDNFCLCDACGQEFVNNNNKVSGNSDVPSLCTNCSNNKPSPKTRTRRSSARSEVSAKTNKNAPNKNNKTQTANKRGKNSIALNGPNKKIRLSTPESAEKDKYKCHICRTLIGTEWEVIQDHFAKEHKNFNLLVLSPRINKIELGETTTIKASSSNADKKVSTSSAGKKVSTVNAEKKSSNINTEKKASVSNLEKETSSSNEEKKAATSVAHKPVKIKTEPVEEKDPEFEPSEEPKVRRTRRKLPPRGVQNTPSPVSSGQLSSSQSRGKSDSNFVCFKCKYQSNNVETFWSHVITHKTDSRAYQCMECGMCFVVKPSFQKHLFISHKIKDVDKYINDHELCHQKPKSDVCSQSEDPGSPSAEDTEELEENQCRVCKVKFETSVQLNKHFRTHGMAFLMMKQQQNRSSQ